MSVFLSVSLFLPLSLPFPLTLPRAIFVILAKGHAYLLCVFPSLPGKSRRESDLDVVCASQHCGRAMLIFFVSFPFQKTTGRNAYPWLIIEETDKERRREGEQERKRGSMSGGYFLSALSLGRAWVPYPPPSLRSGSMGFRAARCPYLSVRAPTRTARTGKCLQRDEAWRFPELK